MLNNNPTIFDTSAHLFNAGAEALAGNQSTGLLGTMNSYANPYTDSVIDQFDIRSREDEAQTLNNVQAQAAGAGAFGGARHGLVEAETRGHFGRSRDANRAELLFNGFNTRAGLAQADLEQSRSNANGLFNASQLAMGLGQTANGGMAQAGQQQQGLLQGILNSGNQQIDQFANYPNTSLGTAMAGLSGNPLAGAGTQTSQFNPGLFNYLQMGSGLLGAGK